jgi:NCS1 family nucleobase:cation symporter-1
VIVTRGVHLLNVSNSFITPGLALLVGYMLYVLLAEYGWEAIASAPPLHPSSDPRVDYAICVELGIASGFSWWGGLGFLARNTRTRRNAVYPELLHLGASFGGVCSVAVFSALLLQSDDPTEWMVPLGGVTLGVLALVFVALANVTTTAVSIYASGLALRHVPFLRGISWRALIAITCLPCIAFVLWPQELYDQGDAFLAYNGTMHAPLAGILTVDFFLLRRQRLSFRSIFDDAPGAEYHYWRGLNVWALLGVPLGQLTYLLLYDPNSGESHWLFQFVPASIAAFAVPALVYGLAMARSARPAARTPAATRPGRSPLAPNI